MKRKIFIWTLALMLVGGTAYAAGASNLVSVLVNGKPVQSGTIIDGHTMLPLRAIAEALGATVDWDGVNKQAKITMPQQPATAQQDGLSLAELNKIGESVALVYGYAGQTAVSQGSGFIVDDDVFVTNWHVAKDADSLSIFFANQLEQVKVVDAVFKDEDADLVGFRIAGYPSLTLDTGQPEPGEKVYAIGYPHAKFQITEGAYVSKWNDDRWLHSAYTGPGASGGIIINVNGEVIGITTTANVDGKVNTAIRSSVLQTELK